MKRKEDSRLRKEAVLEVIVNYYVDSAKPVCSRTVSKRMGLSSATIRNVMQDLEEEGYIKQPHTSAGRVPTEKGYRYYVDSLMHLRKLTEAQAKTIDEEYNLKMRSLDDILAKTSQIISRITKYAGIALIPKTSGSSFRHIDLVPMGRNRVLVVLVTATGMTKDFMIPFDSAPDADTLDKVSNFLNSVIGDMTLDEVKRYLADKIRAERDSSHKVIEQAANVMGKIMISQMEDRLFIDGTSHILAQPEFSDSHKVKSILELIEEKDILMSVLLHDIPDIDTKVHIGAENKERGLSDLSIVTSGYRFKDDVLGRIGVVGPTRMDYTRVIPMVNFLADTLTHILNGDIED